MKFIQGFFPHLRGLSLIPDVDQKLVLYADVGLAKKVPVGWAGEGLSRLLSIYLAMADARDGVVLVDEIGSGIHYSALPKVWRGVAEAADKYQCQVFATTHSYECIQAAKDGLAGLLSPDFMYVLLDKTDKGIVPRLYPYDVLGAALDARLEVRG
ncbi:MAG: ATP-binding protein [Planctomycetes bacterium]|nr:ATP-binding protein [Planctomycetota bacterium]